MSHFIGDVGLVSASVTVTRTGDALTRLKEVTNTAGLCRPSAATMSSCTLWGGQYTVLRECRHHSLLGGSSSQGENRYGVKALLEHRQLAELGSEVVSPATDAVGLVCAVSWACGSTSTYLIDHKGTQQIAIVQ